MNTGGGLRRPLFRRSMPNEPEAQQAVSLLANMLQLQVNLNPRTTCRHHMPHVADKPVVYVPVGAMMRLAGDSHRGPRAAIWAACETKRVSGKSSGCVRGVYTSV